MRSLLTHWFNLCMAAILLTGILLHYRALWRIDREERAAVDKYTEPPRRRVRRKPRDKGR